MLIKSVSDKDLAILEHIAFDILEPLYGDQSKSLYEWVSGEGFKYAFLSKSREGEYQGFISLKINPLKDYVKISTFFVLPNFRGNGIGKSLLQFVFKYVIDLGKYKYLKVTISEDNPESLAFFQKNNFVLTDKIDGKYKHNKTEFILYKEIINEKDIRY